MKIFMIAGPNGAGKTTAAMSLISHPDAIDEFINADEIARGLAPLHPESMALSASKLMIKRFKELLKAKKNFVFETTGSGTNYVKHLQEAQASGYEVHLFFLWLSSPELAIKRVEHRVSQGGHHIPPDIVRRRYYSGIKNLINYYLPLANSALILDSSVAKLSKVVARKNIEKDLNIEETQIWEEIQKVAYETKN